MKTTGILHTILIPLTGIFHNSCDNPRESKPQNPNIIIILSDDQGWGDLSINGNKNLNTANIDRLAQNGVRFNHFYVSPVCSPTRAELLTGRYHDRCGVYSTSEGGERMNLDETTIADIFKKAGYATAAFGKWHNGMQYPYHPNARGFDEFYGFCSGHWGEYFSPQLLEHNGKIVQGNGFIIDDLTEKSMTFIDNNKNNPFFLYIPYNTPHSPMQVPDKWWNLFRGKNLEMLADEHVKEDIPLTRAALAMCENIDWNVGRIMNKLKELNLEQNTIVLYFSDNGPNSWRWNDSMKGRKGSTDEGGVRSPLIIRWTGTIASGSQIDEIAGVIDLLPTLADMAGIEYQIRKPLDGFSLKPLLLKKNAGWNDRQLFSSWNGNVSVRTQKYRLDNQGKLFNIITDPGQLTDISTAEPEVARQLKISVEQWKADVFTGISADKRRFPVGHPNFKYTQLPARDGKAHGNIVRSNKYPNSSFFTNWTKLNDKITWDVEVLSEGDYAVEIYYTCPVKDVGATFQLSFGSEKLVAKITEAHDPPLRGMENDRVIRIESYVKDFKPLNIGVIHLIKGAGELTLQALDIPGLKVMDFRLLEFERY
jgi:arylsulfatase A-like enzyme